MGHQLTFLIKSLGAVPLTFKHYAGEVWRLLADIAWGNGAIVVGGGTVGVMVILGVMGGATVGIEGYTALHLLGMDPLVGAISSTITWWSATRTISRDEVVDHLFLLIWSGFSGMDTPAGDAPLP